MKQFRILPALLAFCLCFNGCQKDEVNPPQVKITCNGQDKAEYVVLKGSQAKVLFEATAFADIDKVEIYTREERKTPAVIASVTRMAGDVDGKTFSREFTFNPINKDVSYMLYVADVNGNTANTRIDFYIDVKEYDGLKLTTAAKDKASYTFMDTKNGVAMHYLQVDTNLDNLDFGYYYNAADASIAAALIPAIEFEKTGVYPAIANTKPITFKRASSYTFTTAADLKTAFDNAAQINQAGGYQNAALALSVGNVLSISNVHGKYGLIKVTAVSAADITFSLAIQR